MNDTPPSLLERRAVLQAAEPRLYPRDLAARLSVTEADLLVLDEAEADPARRATRLRPEWKALLGEVHTLGPVMALTRNTDAVHEKIAPYGAIEGSAHVALFLGEIDLRLFLSAWHHGWAVGTPESVTRRSLQFFGADGVAVHKIFSTADTDLAAWERLVEAFRETAPKPLAIVPPAPPEAPRPDAEIDAAGLLAAWDGLRDTHEFHGMLLRFGVARTQALRLAGPARARPVGGGTLRQVLESAAQAGLEIMVFVGNPGCIQIHTGKVQTLRAAGPWFNVLDPGFNLHLRETAIDTAWVVAKPTADGVVTSLELFDAAGGTIATLFGKRKPGNPEDPAWRALCASLA